MATIHLRLYEELNDYLPVERRKRTFACEAVEGLSLGEVVDALAVPRQEIDVALVDGTSVGFDHPVRDGERIALYPVFESFDVGSVTALPDRPLRRTRFILDVHLGRLARYLRLLGFDCLYRNDAADDELVAVSVREARILLSRDRALVRRHDQSRAYLVTTTAPGEQAAEVVRHLDLAGQVRPFTRCLVCNGRVAPVAAASVAERVPPRVRESETGYRRCSDCGRVYWRGTHWRRMQRLLEAVLGEAEE